MYEDMNIDEVFTETALTDSYIYGVFSANSEMMSLILKALKTFTVIKEENIAEQIAQIERTRLTPLVPKVIQAFRNGDIIIMHGDKNSRFPQSLPFLVTKNGNKIKSIAFTNYHATLGKADAGGTQHLNISYKDLYAYMEGAYVAHNYNVYSNKLTKSMGLMKTTCALYTTLITRVLNKNYSLMNEFDLYDQVVFCIGKFYLERVWMSTNEEVNYSYALNNVKMTNGGRGINLASIDLVNKEYEDKEVASIEDLMSFFRDLSPRLKEINTRFFIQSFTLTYKTPAIFGLEVLPYFLFLVESTLIGSYMVNRDLVMDAIKLTKGMNTFYPELTKVII